MVQHVYIIGSKGLGNYGGYETFVDKLTEYHQDEKNIKYHIACKANGIGAMDEKKLDDAETLGGHYFSYHNAICYKINVPEKLGSAQAIFYDCKSFEWVLHDIKKNHIEHPIVYILACRIGPFVGRYVKELHRLGGKCYVNPDGHEWMRAKWSRPVRWYWKKSEEGMVKHADILICDSKNIEKYIKGEYKKYNPITTYIAYGADIKPSECDDKAFEAWLKSKGLRPYTYYMCCGRFVPENNFATMIREFMKSKTEKDFAIITTENEALLRELDQKLGVRKDKRIKFVGTVYDQKLLKKIRENAYGYFHGHEVGGTNPSLLEALGSTKLNLLLDVGFNREVGADAALYWNKSNGNLARLINQADKMKASDIEKLGQRARRRISDAFSWQYIADQYKNLWEMDR